MVIMSRVRCVRWCCEVVERMFGGPEAEGVTLVGIWGNPLLLRRSGERRLRERERDHEHRIAPVCETKVCAPRDLIKVSLFDPLIEWLQSETGERGHTVVTNNPLISLCVIASAYQHVALSYRHNAKSTILIITGLSLIITTIAQRSPFPYTSHSQHHCSHKEASTKHNTTPPFNPKRITQRSGTPRKLWRRLLLIRRIWRAGDSVTRLTSLSRRPGRPWRLRPCLGLSLGFIRRTHTRLPGDRCECRTSTGAGSACSILRARPRLADTERVDSCCCS